MDIFVLFAFVRVTFGFYRVSQGVAKVINIICGFLIHRFDNVNFYLGINN